MNSQSIRFVLQRGYKQVERISTATIPKRLKDPPPGLPKYKYNQNLNPIQKITHDLCRLCTDLAEHPPSFSERQRYSVFTSHLKEIEQFFRAGAMLSCEAVHNSKCGLDHRQPQLDHLHLLHLLLLPLFFCLGLQDQRSTSWRSKASSTMSWVTKPSTASFPSSTSSTMMSTK